MLKLKQRGNEKKKVLFYGMDGSGKSTAATKYCTENGLNPVGIDIEDTNFTEIPIVDLDLSNDLKAYTNIKNTIQEIGKTDDYDTIILDGVSALLELLTSKAQGQRAYKDRADRWGAILQALINTGKHIIFIGQADMEVIFNNEFQSPKPIIKVNSIVNEKYLTVNEGGKFRTEMIKYRGTDGSKPITPQSTPKPVVKPQREPESGIEDVTPPGELSPEDIKLFSGASGILKAIINKLDHDDTPITQENVLLAIENHPKLNKADKQKCTKIMQG